MSLFKHSSTDQPALAVSLILGALLMLGLQDALSKYLSAYISIWQFQTLRCLVNLCVLLVIVWWLAEPALLKPERVSRVVLRALLQVSATFLFIGSAPLLTLTEMAGGLYTFPLFVAVITSLLPGEHVGPRRWIAIISGFAGTLLILQPGTESFRLASLMPVGAGLFYALFILCTRRLCRNESPIAMVLATNLCLLLVGSCGLLVLTFFPVPPSVRVLNPYMYSAWQPLFWWVAGITVLCGLLNSLANLGLGRAYQSADSSLLAPFDYSYLIFAAIWGYLFWRDIPQITEVIGILMIAGAGLFVAWRERITAQQTR
ncbi:hypothetical protein AB833_04285 [Chromatiales bacterium (ex Bugula neritina AB1)]|nr:hypothetical protein AB833_04285 [Chromatiales bacterium (ex Bugula neritina AB1)]